MKIFGIAGWSGSGKTTLLVRLVPVLVRHGIEVATIKHTHHSPILGDEETRALAAAGAVETLVASPRRFALVRESRDEPEPDLESLVRRVGAVDLLLVEGFKFSGHPKLEVWDPRLDKSPLVKDHPSVVAIATDGVVESHGRPIFRRDDVDSISTFILAHEM